MDSAVSQENSPCGEIFEINDFTVVTELERFVVAIEALIQEWGLSGFRPCRKYGKVRIAWLIQLTLLEVGFCFSSQHLQGGLKNAEWISKSEIVRFGESNKLRVTYYYPDVVEGSYVAKIPTDDDGYLPACAHDMISAETDFVYRSNITSMGSHLRKGQARHQHLGGLLDMFKEHVKCPISLLDAPDIRVSVQFEYIVKVKPKGFLFDDTSGNFIDVTQMPFGSVEHPIDEFKLIAVWPNLKEEMIHENNNSGYIALFKCHTDLELLNAFNWLASVNFVPVEGILSMNAFDHLTDGGIHTLKFGPSSGQSITNPGGILMDQTLLPIKKVT
uniref:Uncharacterized protein n=1 Tax=Heterorhabditis bacteriophora TaxID=37862 RepID=A0A1I7XM56_HETBA